MKSFRAFFVLFVVAAFGVCVSVAFGQGEKKIDTKDLPTAVTASFHKSYPTAKILGASTETEKGVKYFEVESKDGSVGRDILYTQDGTAYEIEETVAPGELPAPVKATLSKEMPKAKILKAEKTTVGSEIHYEMSVSLKRKTYSMSIDPTGKVLEKKAAKTGAESEKEEDEEAKENKK